jgi:hypothetical protein
MYRMAAGVSLNGYVLRVGQAGHEMPEAPIHAGRMHTEQHLVVADLGPVDGNGAAGQLRGSHRSGPGTRSQSTGSPAGSRTSASQNVASGSQPASTVAPPSTSSARPGVAR